MLETDSNKTIKVKYIRDTSGKALAMAHYPQTQDPSPETRTYYYLYNAHGDVTGLTDSSGSVVATYTYDEFGNQVAGTGYGVQGTEIYNPLRYSGANNAYYDTETGLYKMGTRYYNPEVGRWLTRDSFKGDQASTQSLNRYTYVENNPLSKVDPTGLKAWPSARRINKSDRFAYRNFIKSRWPSYVGNMYGKPDCADLAIKIMIDFAANRKVSIVLKSFDKSYDSNNYNSKEKYYEATWKAIGAEMIAKKNSKKLYYVWKSTQPGDLLMLDKPTWDTKIVTSKGRKGGLYYWVIHQNPDTPVTHDKHYVRDIKPRMFKQRPRRWNWQ